MNLLSLTFVGFLVAVTFAYYIVPKRAQWMVLLAASLIFYAWSGPRNLLFIGLTALSSWAAARAMDGISRSQKEYLAAHKAELDKAAKSLLKKKYQARRRRIMAATLVFNFGLLVYFKYLHFLAAQLNALLGLFHGPQIVDTWKIIVPLGISYYTFQTMGYVVDVYWKKIPAEPNFAKLLLFTSFFPQLTQGPISDFAELTGELFAEHTYSYRNFSWGAMRMFWGFYKKMALANAIATYTDDLFARYNEYTGIAALIGIVLYSVQIYADFSGYMDIVCGFSEILGITLTENFRQPYFSRSVAEYWRRWHISLGRWFKTYIYYPIAVAKWNLKLGQITRDRLGQAFGRALPASLALVVTWLTTGLWHGATWGYVVWGGVNGLFIIFSLWMEPVFASWKEKIGVTDETPWFRLFQIVRTFALIMMIKILPEVGTLGQGLGLWHQVFADHRIPHCFADLVPMAHFSYVNFAAICGGSVLLFAADLIQLKQPVRQWLTDHVPYLARILLFVLLFIVTIYIGYPLIDATGGFMYAEF